MKTSVTLSAELVEELDGMTDENANRSQMIEKAVAEFIEREHRQLRNERDLKILNRSADELNQEIDDILTYQAIP